MFTQHTEAKAGFLIVCLTPGPGLSLKCESSRALAHVPHPYGQHSPSTSGRFTVSQSSCNAATAQKPREVK